MDNEMIAKLAYAIYEDRIREERRVGFSLGSSESDWLRAERIIDFFQSPWQDTWQWRAKFEDYEKYIGIYERLKCEQPNP
jgi:hypothetical protein